MTIMKIFAYWPTSPRSRSTSAGWPIMLVHTSYSARYINTATECGMGTFDLFISDAWGFLPAMCGYAVVKLQHCSSPSVPSNRWTVADTRRVYGNELVSLETFGFVCGLCKVGFEFSISGRFCCKPNSSSAHTTCNSKSQC